MAKCRVCGGIKPPISQIRGVCNKFECIQQAKAETPQEKKKYPKIKRDLSKLKKKVNNFHTFAKYQWDLRKNKKGEVYCEETDKFLGYDFDPKKGHGMCVSHILSGSAYPEFYYHPLNCNILSHAAHRKWEEGDKQSMNIYFNNLVIIENIKKTPDLKVEGINI